MLDGLLRPARAGVGAAQLTGGDGALAWIGTHVHNIGRTQHLGQTGADRAQIDQARATQETGIGTGDRIATLLLQAAQPQDHLVQCDVIGNAQGRAAHVPQEHALADGIILEQLGIQYRPPFGDAGSAVAGRTQAEGGQIVGFPLGPQRRHSHAQPQHQESHASGSARA